MITAFHVRGNLITLKTDRRLAFKEALTVDIGRNLEKMDVSYENGNLRFQLGTKPTVIFALFNTI